MATISINAQAREMALPQGQGCTADVLAAHFRLNLPLKPRLT